MRRTFRHLCAFCSLGAMLLAGTADAAAPRAAPSNSAEAKAQLAAVRAQIAELAKRLGAELKERDAVSARLRDTELDITAKRQALDALRASELTAERRRAQLHSEQAHTQASIDAERSQLAAQVLSAAMIGRQDELKLLLSQSDPARLGRLMTYYGYLGSARAAQIQAIVAQAQRLEAIAAEMEEQSAQLKALEADANRELQALEKLRTARAGMLAALKQQVSGADQQLARLKREEQAVESLLEDLSRVIQDFPTDSQQHFADMRGKLPWPVPGRLVANFHDVRADSAQGDLRWNGVLIESSKGARVRAPYFGRVVYADWLQGLGLLLIISHSDGYLSLYGHAEVIYKSVGDWVAPGDEIAAMSDAPGENPRLYFEIRQGRKPVDPRLWLK